MRIRDHILYSAIVNVVLYYFFGWHSLLFFIFGVGIDVDHYIHYILRLKKYNLFKAYKYFEEVGEKKIYSRVKGKYFVFHSLEFLILVGLLSFVYAPMIFAFGGVFLHYLMDTCLEIFVTGKPMKALSLFEGFFKKR